MEDRDYYQEWSDAELVLEHEANPDAFIKCSPLGAALKPDPDQLAQPPTDEQRRENWRALHAMHPGNRFRLMFGMPLLPEPADENNSI